MPDALTISVTPEHRRLGKRSDCWACPIALSIQEELKGEVRAKVMPHRVFLYTGDGEYDIYTCTEPDKLLSFIGLFDIGRISDDNQIYTFTFTKSTP